MNNILIAGDLHINLSSLNECYDILNEEKELIKTYKVDTYIDTGDTFDFLRPESDELDLFSNFLKDINIHSIILAANSHESSTPESSIINHFGILNSKVEVVKEFSDRKKLYVGHFGLMESNLQKYGATHSISEFQHYLWVVLGHFHSFERIGKNGVQLGSSRYVTFAESGDKRKIVLLIEGYDSDKPKCSFLALKSPIPMIDVYLDPSIEKIANKPYSAANLPQILPILDRIPAKTKVRVIVNDYLSWRELLNYEKTYIDKFSVFKIKKDFILQNIISIAKKENISLKDALIKWMTANNVDEKIREILLQEVK